MPEPGEGDNADRQRLEHPVVALERCGVPVPGPVGLEDDLRHLAAVGPASGDTLGAFWRAAVQQHHVGVLGAHLVERFPDAPVIVAIGAAGEAMCGPEGARTCVSARRRAVIKSRLAIIGSSPRSMPGG